MRGCSAFCKCYTSRSWLENKKPFLYSLKRRHVIISNKIIIICRPANCAASLSHNREVPLTSPSLYLFPPPPKKTRRKLQSRFLKQEMELAFFFFANDGSSVCVKESERQRERGSTLISSIMTHGGGGGESVCESHIKGGAVSAEGYAYISLVLPVQQERAQKLMTGRRRCCGRGWSARTGETKQSGRRE